MPKALTDLWAARIAKLRETNKAEFSYADLAELWDMPRTHVGPSITSAMSRHPDLFAKRTARDGTVRVSVFYPAVAQTQAPTPRPEPSLPARPEEHSEKPESPPEEPQDIQEPTAALPPASVLDGAVEADSAVKPKTIENILERLRKLNILPEMWRIKVAPMDARWKEGPQRGGLEVKIYEHQDSYPCLVATVRVDNSFIVACVIRTSDAWL